MKGCQRNEETVCQAFQGEGRGRTQDLENLNCCAVTGKEKWRLFCQSEACTHGTKKQSDL